MRRWPPILWIVVSLASVLILMGSSGRWYMVAAGLVLAFGAYAISAYLALGPWDGRPRPRWFFSAVGGGIALYLALGLIIGVAAGTDFGVAAVAAGLVPLTALNLLLATLRSKTVQSPAGLRDLSAERHGDPLPGVGMAEDANAFLGPAKPDPEAAELERRGRQAAEEAGRSSPSEVDELEALKRRTAERH
jgi:predicted lipid-binding transport protein (Tim44 family)